MNHDEQRALIERYISAYNAFDIDGMLAVMHPEVEFKNLVGGKLNAAASGAEELRRLAERSSGLFRVRRQTLTAFHPGEESASVEVSFEGVLAVDLPNGLKAGDVLQLKGRSEFGFRAGKIGSLADIS